MADHHHRHKHHGAGNAKRQAKANAADVDRGKGGGSVEIDGTALAQSQAIMSLRGVRDGIDGDYRISSVEHTYTRGGGWTSKCALGQPGKGTGQDDRKAG